MIRAVAWLFFVRQKIELFGPFGGHPGGSLAIHMTPTGSCSLAVHIDCGPDGEGIAGYALGGGLFLLLQKLKPGPETNPID